MAKFQIPDFYWPGFDAILKLSNEEVHGVANAIKEIPVGASPKAILKYITGEADIEDIEKIAITLNSIVGIRSSENTTDLETATEIVESYNFSSNSNLSKQETEDLVEKLLLFFSSFNNLNITYKARNLILANDKIYRESKILSDIRLVFNDDIQEVNRYAVIIHKLKIKYLNDETDKEFYISLDSSDLKSLKEQVDRALEKDGLIKNDYKGSINFIDLE